MRETEAGIDSAKVLGRLNDHGTPGQIIGLGNPFRAEQRLGLDAVESQLRAVYQDNSMLYEVDQGVYSLLYGSLSPGSIIDIGVMQSGSRHLNAKEAQVFVQHSAVAIVLGHSPYGIELLGVERKPRKDGNYSWGSYRAAEGVVYEEKQDAQQVLARIFSLTEGIEGSQILSHVFTNQMLVYGGDNRSISSAGCFSHENPKQAIPLNFLLENLTDPMRLVINGNVPGQFIRVKTDGITLTPLTTIHEWVDNDHLLDAGLVYRAQTIAADNPLGWGRGTDPSNVLEGMMKTAIKLPELVGNGATNNDASKMFKNSMGLLR